MNKCLIAVGSVLALGLLCGAAGCSKKPQEKVVQEKKAEAEQDVPVVKEYQETSDEFSVLPVLPVAEKRPVPPAEPSEEPKHISLFAVLEGEGGVRRAGLVDSKTDRSDLVRVGDSFGSYELVEVSLEDESIVLRQGDETYVIKMIQPGASSPGPGAAPGKVHHAVDAPIQDVMPVYVEHRYEGGIDVIAEDTLTFEATPEESQAGIDPNDATTWPDWYRGPGIERAMFEQGGALPQDIPDEAYPEEPPEEFEPTPEEIAAGIDPNDDTTWPPTYRGPVIERALKNVKEAQ